MIKLDIRHLFAEHSQKVASWHQESFANHIPARIVDERIYSMRNAYYILQYCPILPLTYGIIHIRKLSQSLRLLLVWQASSLLFTIVMTVLSIEGKNNLWLMNLSLPVYTIIVMWMFAVWGTSRKLQRTLATITGLMVVFWLAEILFGRSLFTFTALSRPIMSVIFITVACVSVYDDNKNTEVLLVDQPRYWISSGIIIYYSGTLTVNLLSHTLLKVSEEALRNALLIQSGLNLVSSLLYTQGLRIKCLR